MKDNATYEATVGPVMNWPGYYGILIPVDIVERMSSAEHRRVICTIENSITFHCAMMPGGDDVYYIYINKETRKKLGLDYGSKISVSLRPDESKYGMPLPEEMAEMFALDEEVDKIFHALTPGKQRSLIHLIAKNKRPATRINKTVAMFEYLKECRGKIDYKAMHAYMRDYNKL